MVGQYLNPYLVHMGLGALEDLLPDLIWEIMSDASFELGHYLVV